MSIDRVVQNCRPALAKRAWEFAEEAQVRSALQDLDPTPLRTLLSVANGASCLKELHIMLRYQQGRDKKTWPDVLAEGIFKATNDVVNAARPQLNGLPEADRDRAEILLAATWLGFVARLHRYQHSLGKQNEGRSSR